MPSSTTPDGWLYEHTPDDAARFVLGTVGVDPLVCVGANPSTARPLMLDPTAVRVARRSLLMGHDSWIMLNLYPQRSTDPAGVHAQADPALMAQNETHIAALLESRRVSLLAAWGELITTRDYLSAVLARIARIAADASCDWVSIGPPLKGGHPRHPLRTRYDMHLEPFDMDRYIRGL